jgi:hypothetical protein
MSVDDVLDESEAQSRPVFACREEGLEHPWSVLRGNTAPSVDHVNANGIVVGGQDRHQDFTLF